MKPIFKTAVIVMTLFAVSCGGADREKGTEAAPAERTEYVRVTELKQKSVARTIEYTATLQAYEEIHLVPATPGRIESIHVEVGQRVSKGALLVQMDRTQLHQAEIQLRNLETDFRRLDTLQKTGSVSKQQYDQIKTQYEIAGSNVEFLRQNTRLTAPFSGVISGKYFESGEMYSGAPNTPAGKAAIVSLVQIDRLKAVVPISERYFPLIKTGMSAEIVSDIYPDKRFSGTIFRIHPTIDPATRTFSIEIMTSNSSGLLRPGMFSRVNLDLEKVEALLLPANAVLKTQGSNDRFLFIEKDGVASRIPVTIGKRYDDLVEVFSDQLSKGDHVIISGQARLVDGVKVEVVK